MPHLIIEATPHIARLLDFRSLMGRCTNSSPRKGTRYSPN